MPQRILGLDIGKSSVKGAVLQIGGKAPEIVAFASEALLPPATPAVEGTPTPLQDALRGLLAKLGPVEQIVTALPGESVASAAMDFPFSDPRKIGQTLGFQLDEVSPFEIEELAYDHQFIEAEKDKARLLVGSLPKDGLRSFLAELQGAQVDPRIVMLDGSPYLHLFSSMPPPAYEAWAVLDVGEQHTTMTLFRRWPDGTPDPIRVEGVRSISRGRKQLQAALVSALKLDPESAASYLQHHLALDGSNASYETTAALEALGRAITPILTEIRRTLIAFQRRFPQIRLEHLYLAGGGSLLRGFDLFLGQRLGMQVSYLQPRELSLAIPQGWPDDGFLYLKALGMALRSTSRSKFTQINFRKNEFSFKGDLQFLKDRLGTILVGTAILLLLMFTSIGMQFYVLSKEGRRLEAQVEERCRKILGRSVRNASQCVNVMLEEIQKARGDREKSSIPQVSAYDIFLEVYDRVAKLLKTQQLKVEINSLRIIQNRFEIEGETTSYASVDQIEQQLRAYPCFKDIRKGRVQQASSKRNKIEFRLWSPLSC